MRTIITMCLTGALALSIVSCACPRCRGMGTEIAIAPGVHPYTNKPYNANEMIPCLKCGGMGERGNTPAASQFSGGAALKAAYTMPTPTKTTPVHYHEHYNQYNSNYVVY